MSTSGSESEPLVVGPGVWGFMGLGLRVMGSGSRVWGCGFRVEGLGFRV